MTEPHGNGCSCCGGNIGQSHAGIKVEEINSKNGQHYWKATCEINNIFGADVEGPLLEGIGTTEEQALKRLGEEQRKFNDSLWI